MHGWQERGGRGHGDKETKETRRRGKRGDEGEDLQGCPGVLASDQATGVGSGR